MDKTPALKIKNRNLFSLCRFLAAVSLAGKESRERTRFIEVVEPRITEMEKERVELLKKYADKDENNNPIIKEDAGKSTYDLSDENMEKFTKEYEDYVNEEFVLDILDGNLAKIKTVRDIVLNTEEKFNGPSAAEYDTWCEAFEALNLD